MYKEKNAVQETPAAGHKQAGGGGLPAQLKARMEQKTGLSFDDVRVHYHSDRPQKLQALAYTQGSQVYLAPRQEHLLPHELGHVVQQKAGLVRADTMINGLPVNTDERLELDADRTALSGTPVQARPGQAPVIQRYKIRPGSISFGASDKPTDTIDLGNPPDAYFHLKRQLNRIPASTFDQPTMSSQSIASTQTLPPKQRLTIKIEPARKSVVVTRSSTQSTTIVPSQQPSSHVSTGKPETAQVIPPIQIENSKKVVVRPQQPTLSSQVSADKPPAAQASPPAQTQQPLACPQPPSILHGELGDITAPFLNGLYKSGQKPWEMELTPEKVFHASVWKTGRDVFGRFIKTDPITFELQLEQKEIDQIKELGEDIWVMIPDYATGDQFTLAALLLHNPKFHVCIQGYKYNDPKQCDILKLFEKTLGATSQELRIPGSNSCAAIQKDGTIRVVYQPQRAHYPGILYTAAPAFATDKVARNYEPAWAGNLRKEWKLTPDSETPLAPSITSWLEQKNAGLLEALSTKNKNVFILWLRHSGARGGAHLEHDSGTPAMCQLAAELLHTNTNSIVILAGDREDTQVQELLRANQRIFDLTEFWKSRETAQASAAAQTPAAGEGELLKSWGGNQRPEQTRLYDWIAEHARSVRHIGSRSGNLELMALLGHKVNYIEEQNSYGGTRMLPFHNSDKLHYKRVLVSRPLTLEGNLVRMTNYLFIINPEFCTQFRDIPSPSDMRNLLSIGEKMRTPPVEWESSLASITSPDVAQRALNFYDALRDQLRTLLKDQEKTRKYAEYTNNPANSEMLQKFQTDLKYMNLLNPMIIHLAQAFHTEFGQNALELQAFSGFPEGSLPQFITDLKLSEPETPSETAV